MINVELSPDYHMPAFFFLSILRGLGRAVIVSCLVIYPVVLRPRCANVKYMFILVSPDVTAQR